MTCENREQHAARRDVGDGQSGSPTSEAPAVQYAAQRLANAVAVFLEYRDPSSLSALKQMFSEYRQAERGGV